MNSTTNMIQFKWTRGNIFHGQCWSLISSKGKKVYRYQTLRKIYISNNGSKSYDGFSHLNHKNCVMQKPDGLRPKIIFFLS